MRTSARGSWTRSSAAGLSIQTMFWWGCHVGDHRAWAFVDGHGRQEVLEGALPPVLRERAVVHRLSRMDGRELRRWHEAQDDAPGMMWRHGPRFGSRGFVCYTAAPWPARPEAPCRPAVGVALTLAAGSWYPYVLLLKG